MVKQGICSCLVMIAAGSTCGFTAVFENLEGYSCRSEPNGLFALCCHPAHPLANEVSVADTRGRKIMPHWSIVSDKLKCQDSSPLIEDAMLGGLEVKFALSLLLICYHTWQWCTICVDQDLCTRKHIGPDLGGLCWCDQYNFHWRRWITHIRPSLRFLRGCIPECLCWIYKVL